MGKLEITRPLGRRRLSKRIILRWILEKWNGIWIGLIWLQDMDQWTALVKLFGNR
jgi:hypothetical protein